MGKLRAEKVATWSELFLKTERRGKVIGGVRSLEKLVEFGEYL